MINDTSFFICDDCNVEYEIIHNEEDPPEYCSFCGWHNIQKDDEREWEN